MEPSKKRCITREQIQQARKTIEENNQDNIPLIIQKEWFRRLKRAVAIGSQLQYQELIQQYNQIEPFDYQTLYQQTDPTKNTILHNACLNHRKTLVTFLLENGFQEQVNMRNADGETPCMQAIINICVNNKSKLDILRLLISKGADILAVNKTGKNIVEIAKTMTVNADLIQKIEELYTQCRRDRDRMNAIFLMKYTKVGKCTHPLYSKLNNWLKDEIISFI